MGVHTKLTPIVGDKIVECVGKGYPRATAAAMVGVSPSAIHLWMSKGEQGEEPYAAFYARMITAEAESIGRLIDIVYDPEKLTTKVALSLLRARRPEDFGRKDNVTINHGLAQAPDGGSAVDELVRRFAKMSGNLTELDAPIDPKPE